MNTIILEKVKDEAGNEHEVTFDVYQKLAHDRVFFITEYLNDQTATNLVAFLFLKSAEDPKQKITLIINNDGADLRSCFMVYDAMKLIKNPLETICLGATMGEMVLILGSGTHGMRKCAKNAILMMSQLEHQHMQYSDLSDAKALMERSKHDNREFLKALAKACKKTVATLTKELPRKKFMGANEAKKFGLIDKII